MALDIITGVSNVFRRDYSVPDAELPGQASGFLNPNASDALKQGEWVFLNSSGQVIRPTTLSGNPFASATSATDFVTEADTGQAVYTAMCVFSVQGDYPAQALGKVTCIQSYGWEGETDQYVGTPNIGDLLAVTNDAGQIRSVLGATSTDADIIVAICTRGVSGGKIRFRALQPYEHHGA